MTRTITIGKGNTTTSRDYATLGAFVADVGVGLPAGPAASGETQPWEVLCYNDDGTAIQETDEVTTKGLFWDGSTNHSSATYDCTIKPASGNGLGGDPNDHRTRTGALDYDPSFGVAFEWSGAHYGLREYNWDISVAPFLNYEGLQFYHSAINYSRSLFTKRRAAATTVNQCIFKCTPAVDRDSEGQWTGRIFYNQANHTDLVISNNLLIMSGDATHVPDQLAAGLGPGGLLNQFYNNTIINELHATAKDMVGAIANAVTADGVFANNLILGFDTPWDNSGSTFGTQEYTVTDASTCDGSNNTTSAILADQIQSVTAGSLNARLKPGSDAIGTAGGTYIATNDIFGITRSDPEDVGCAEFSGLVGSGLIDGNKLQRGKLISC